MRITAVPSRGRCSPPCTTPLGRMVLEGGARGQSRADASCPGSGTLDGWAYPGGEGPADLSAATASTLDTADLVLPEAFLWIDGGYEIANPLAGRLLPTLTPLLGLLALLSAFAVCWRQWHSDGA